MMVDTDKAILPAGATSVLTSLAQLGSTRTECVYFWYHMGGGNPGEQSSHTEHTLTATPW